MTTYGLAGIPSGSSELVHTENFLDGADHERFGNVDLDDLKSQITDIRNSLGGISAEQGDSGASGGGFMLKEFSVGLTLSATGKVLFIASGTVEASITLTFSKPDAPA